MIPDLPPDATPQEMAAWRLAFVKQVGLAAMITPVMLVAAPIINIHAAEYSATLGLMVTLPLVLAFGRGARCMIYDIEEPGAGFEVLLGALAACLALLAVPYSVQVSLANFGDHPGWIVMTLGGAAFLIGYLYFAFRRLLRK